MPVEGPTLVWSSLHQVYLLAHLTHPFNLLAHNTPVAAAVSSSSSSSSLYSVRPIHPSPVIPSSAPDRPLKYHTCSKPLNPLSAHTCCSSGVLLVVLVVVILSQAHPSPLLRWATQGAGTFQGAAPFQGAGTWGGTAFLAGSLQDAVVLVLLHAGAWAGACTPVAESMSLT